MFKTIKVELFKELVSKDTLFQILLLTLKVTSLGYGKGLKCVFNK